MVYWASQFQRASVYVHCDKKKNVKLGRSVAAAVAGAQILM